MLSVFCSPSRYTQGKNATAVLGAEMAGLGLSGPALIVASQSPIRLLSEVWKQTFAEAGMAYAVFKFGGECSLAEIERIKQAAKQHKSQVIVGAGGGKVLDAARAAAADLNLPIVNCPTVASSDSPCSALSVIYSDDGIVQGSRFHRKNADLVLVDTQVIAKVRLGCWWRAWGMRWRRGSRRKPVSMDTSEPARRLIDADRLGPGETLLRHIAGRWRRRFAVGANPGRDPGPGATGGGQYTAVRDWLRVFGLGRRPRHSQRLDHG